jgi:hypothetical protein
MSEIEKIKTYYCFCHKDIPCEVLETECLSSSNFKAGYIYINKIRNPKLSGLFDFLYLRKERDYDKLERENKLQMEGGITYYLKTYARNKCYCLTIGNDYNHIWNSGRESIEDIKLDLINSINRMLISFEKWKIENKGGDQ